jgi:hypothetical protein
VLGGEWAGRALQEALVTSKKIERKQNCPDRGQIGAYSRRFLSKRFLIPHSVLASRWGPGRGSASLRRTRVALSQ